MSKLFCIMLLVLSVNVMAAHETVQVWSSEEPYNQQAFTEALQAADKETLEAYSNCVESNEGENCENNFLGDIEN